MDEYQKYLNIALKFLSFRPRSEKEIVDKLKEKKAPQEVINSVIIQLKDHKFLNDEEFAQWFTEQRLRFRPKSLQTIKFELKLKGIDQEIIDQAIVNLDKDENTADHDLESAKRLVEKKIDKYRDVKRQEVYQKLGGFLARRGFDWDTIKKSIDYVLSKGV